MASSLTATLSNLLGSASIHDHEEVLKATNATLKKNKADEVALHGRVVALLKLDRFDDALRALEDGGDRLAAKCVLEKAYALYKSGRLDEAEGFMSNLELQTSRGLEHLAAQLAYRAQKFEQAAAIYRKLSMRSASIDGEENDIKINSAAVDAQLEWQGNGHLVESGRKKARREDLEAFETAYNAACASIAREDLSSGSVLLKRARDLCEALDELTEEEKRSEILPIMVQQAYVLARLGKEDEARTLQRQINVAEVPEPPTRLVAQNNALALLSGLDNPYQTERLFTSFLPLSNTEGLFEYQDAILRNNRGVVELKAHKHEGVRRATAKKLLSQQLPSIESSIVQLSVLNAASQTVGGPNAKALLPVVEKRPLDIGLALTVAQIHVSSGSLPSATMTIESLCRRLEESSSPPHLDARFAPGLVALLVALYQSQNRKAAAQEELKNAALHWKTRSKSEKGLLRAAGIALLESAEPDALDSASRLFRQLLADHPDDALAAAGLAAGQATTEYTAAEVAARSLPLPDKVLAGIDAEALEAGGIATRPTAMPDVSKKREAATEKERPVKKRKPILPKDFDEGRQPDPERWLPLKDRSSYKPKGKKGKKKAMDATQGGPVKEEESLELVGGAGAVKVEKAPVSGSNNKKKKKGKK